MSARPRFARHPTVREASSKTATPSRRRANLGAQPAVLSGRSSPAVQCLFCISYPTAWASPVGVSAHYGEAVGARQEKANNGPPQTRPAGRESGRGRNEVPRRTSHDRKMSENASDEVQKHCLSEARPGPEPGWRAGPEIPSAAEQGSATGAGRSVASRVSTSVGFGHSSKAGPTRARPRQLTASRISRPRGFLPSSSSPLASADAAE